MSRRTRGRCATGQTLTEGICGLSLLLGILVLFTAFGLNIYLYMVDSARLQLVADETAKRMNDLYFWCGAKRPIFQQRTARDGSRTNLSGPAIGGGTHTISQSQMEAAEYATNLAAKLGLSTNGLDIRFSDPIVQEDFEYTKVQITGTRVNFPFYIDKVFPGFVNLSAVGVAVQATAPPPAFIRLGYNLISGDTINPSDTTDVTQVCILPSYGFQTDFPSDTPGVPAETATLGGTTNNDDVVANQPNDLYCGYNGLNVDTVQLPNSTTKKTAIFGTPPMQKNSNGGHTWYFDTTPKEVRDPQNLEQ